MATIKHLGTIIFVFTLYCNSLFSQIDSTDHNGIWEIGLSHRFSSKASNEIGTDRSEGVQYTLDIGHEWNINSKNKLGFIISTQFLGKSSDTYIAPMFVWNHIQNQNWSHKFATGPIVYKGHSDVDFINGFSLSYDIEIGSSFSISNRFDLLYDTQTNPIYSYSPGIELRGSFGKIFIITGAVASSIGALIVFDNFSSN